MEVEHTRLDALHLDAASNGNLMVETVGDFAQGFLKSQID